MPSKNKKSLVERLNEVKGNFPEIAAEAGLSYFTVQRIASGVVADPKSSTTLKLERALEKLNIKVSKNGKSGK
jgi:hypothetical protein